MVLANVASKCSISAGAMGASGFIYESVKDELSWAGLRKKFYTRLLMQVGTLIVMEEEHYKKAVVERGEMSDDEIANVLKTAFLVENKKE